MILAGITLISFIFFPDDKIIAPRYGTMFGFLLLVAIAMGESWEAWKRKGQIILTTLGVGKGGATGLNPVGDIRLAKTNDPDSLPFAVIATGGFVFAGFSMNGNENFIVCPPEHVMQFGGNVIVKTKLKPVRFSALPPYIQHELCQLTRFRRELAEKKKNIFFGMTSSYYGTDTIEDMKREAEALAKLDVSNATADMLSDILDQKDRVSRFKKRMNRDYDVVKVSNKEE